MKQRRGKEAIQSHDDGPAIRTYSMVADEWFRRSGQRISNVRVQQICARVEAKLRRSLAAFDSAQDAVEEVT